MGIVNTISTAQEAINTKMPNAESIKATAINTCHSAISTCKGSGSIKTELGNLASSCVNLPIGMAANTLKACTQLLTLQPINATCTVAKGLKDACTDAAKVIVSPVPTALAVAGQSLSAAKTVAKLPLTAPIEGYRIINRGVTRATDLMFGGTTPTVPPKDAASAGPPPAPSGASTPQAA